VTHSARLDELRRRVQADPTSIAFAALAEEYRRAGLADQAVEVCRTGLRRHPAYLSARVTLGRALIELNQINAARAELEQVLSVAPENLTALRALGEIGAGQKTTAGPAPATAVVPPPNDPAALVARHPVSLTAVSARSAHAAVIDVPGSPRPDPPALSALHRFLDAVLQLRSHSA
jgi:tetratricopeptide (TPR) repeat protein